MFTKGKYKHTLSIGASRADRSYGSMDFTPGADRSLGPMDFTRSEDQFDPMKQFMGE